jgi:hypothetical protein
MQWEDRDRAGRLGFTEKDFKVCDFCGALNLVTNTECFVCSWRGTFHRDSERIREAMRVLEMEHGQLTEALFAEEVVPDQLLPRPGVWQRLVERIKSFFTG